jgi:GGDEF domain-containing protein
MPNNKTENITLSIGAASFPQDSKEPGSLVAKADQALYKDKKHS